MVVHSHSSCSRDGHGASRGRVGVGAASKDGELVSMTRQLVWSINESLCTLNQDAWIKGHSILPIFPQCDFRLVKKVSN